MVKNKLIKFKLLFTIIFFLLFIFIVFSLTNKDKRSNEEIIFDSIIKTVFLDSYESSFLMYFNKIENENDKISTSILKDLSVVFETKYNKQTNEFALNYNILIRKISILKGFVYLNDDKIYISAPDLYNKVVYINWKDLEKEYKFNKELVRNLIYSIRENLIKRSYRSISEFDGELYVKTGKTYIETILSEKIKKEHINIENNLFETKKYNLNSSTKQTEELIENILYNLLNDSKLKIFMDRYNLEFLFDEEDINNFIFNNETILNIESNLYVDKNDIVRKNECIINFEDDYKIEMIFDIMYRKANERVTFKEFELMDSVDFNQVGKDDLLDIKNKIFKLLNIKEKYYE